MTNSTALKLFGDKLLTAESVSILNPERMYFVEEIWRDATYSVCTCKTKQLAEQVCKYLNSKDKKRDSPTMNFQRS